MRAVTVPAGVALGSFGEKLRQQREQRGLSLDAISTTTKISTRMLRAIEEEHFDQLPGGVFNKGFVRAYARQVGLDEEETVADYLAALRESQVQSQTILPNFHTAVTRPATENDESDPRHHNGGNPQLGNRPRSGADGRIQDGRTQDRRTHLERRVEARRSQDRNNEARPSEDRREDHLANRTEPGLVETHLDENAVKDLPSLPPSFLNLDGAPSSSQPTHSEPRAAESTPSASSFRSARWQKLAVPLSVVLALAFSILYRHNHPTVASHPTALSQPAAVSESAPSSSRTAPPAAVASPATPSSAATGSLKPSPAAGPPNPEVKPPAAPPDAQVAQPKPSPTFTLVIRAAQTSWIAITADGQPVAHETLIAPANTSVRASHEIIVRAGNAAGVSFLLNHQEIPAQGSPGEVRTYTFDATGLRDSTIVQPAPPPANRPH